jgi:hypothetical protein
VQFESRSNGSDPAPSNQRVGRRSFSPLVGTRPSGTDPTPLNLGNHVEDLRQALRAESEGIASVRT